MTETELLRTRRRPFEQRIHKVVVDTTARANGAVGGRLHCVLCALSTWHASPQLALGIANIRDESQAVEILEKTRSPCQWWPLA